MFFTLMLFLKRIFLILKKKHHQMTNTMNSDQTAPTTEIRSGFLFFSITSAEREQMTVVRSGGKRVNPLHAW